MSWLPPEGVYFITGEAYFIKTFEEALRDASLTRRPVSVYHMTEEPYGTGYRIINTQAVFLAGVDE